MRGVLIKMHRATATMRLLGVLELVQAKTKQCGDGLDLFHDTIHMNLIMGFCCGHAKGPRWFMLRITGMLHHKKQDVQPQTPTMATLQLEN